MLLYKFKYWLSNIKFKLKNYFRNIWLFRKALANTVQWDYHGILLLMKTQLTSLEENLRLHGHHLNAENHCKRMRECIHLLDRISKDEYSKADYCIAETDTKGEFMVKVTPLYDYPKNSKVISDYTHKQRKKDLDRLFYLMSKHLFSWWD